MAPTEFYKHEDLTWPEVAALPRDLPLVIPLGQGFLPARIAEALGDPPRVGILPSIPYGWRGSGLEVPEEVMAAFANNLADSLRDDGFRRVHLLAPEGVNLGAAGEVLRYEAPATPALRADSDLSRVVIVPVGHTEQHGHHLPLNTDTLIIQAISDGVARALPDETLALPVMPYGVSTHRRSFAATLNAGGRAFEDFFLAVIDSLAAHGLDRMYLMSGHGGNCSFLTTVVKYAGERHPRRFIATAYLYLSGPEGIAALEKHRRSTIGGMGHADELETSMMLYLRPDLVRLDQVVDEIDFVSTPSYYMDWIEGGALIANPPWDDDTRTGPYGAGSLAEAQQGRLWLQAAIDEKVAHIHEINEQQRRREERRAAGFGLWGRH